MASDPRKEVAPAEAPSVDWVDCQAVDTAIPAAVSEEALAAVAAGAQEVLAAVGSSKVMTGSSRSRCFRNKVICSNSRVL